MKRLLARWGLWLFFIWLVTFVFSYHLLHFPFLANVAIAARSILTDLLAVSVLLVLAGALGNLVLRSLDAFSLPEQAALQALLGLGVISLMVLVAGMVELFPPTWLAWTITLLCLAALHRPALAWLRTLKGASMQLLGLDAAEGLFARWMRIGVLTLLVLAALMTLAPPTQWDSLTYHLAGPRIFLDAGRIISFPEMHYLGFPLLTEMLYTWLMILARPQAAAMLHWCFGFLMLLMVLGLAGRMGRPLAGWVAAAILVGGGLLWEEFHWAYSDLSAVAYVLAALIVILAWREFPELHRYRKLAWAGVFAGLAMGTKYTVAGPVIGLGILVLWLACRDGLPGLLRAGGTISAAALLVFSPWLIKNIILYGNPVAPFIWGTIAYDQYDQYSYLHLGSGYTDPVSLLMVPLQGTIFGQIHGGPGDIGGPLLFSLLPLAAIGWRRRTAGERQFIASMLVFVVPSYLLWIYGISVSFYLGHTRLLFPLLPAVALAGAFGLESLGELLPAPDIEKLIRVVVSISLAVAVFAATVGILGADSLRVSFGLMSEDDYLTQSLPSYYEAMQRINKELSPEARILFLWEPRTFYCRRDCIPDSLLNQWWHDLQVEPDPRKVAQRWREQGITHVLIWDAGMESLVSPDMKYELIEPKDVAALETVRREDLVLAWDVRLPLDGASDFVVYSLYELKDAQP